MSTTPNPQTLDGTTLVSSVTLHPDYEYWAPYWRMIRDAEIGEIEIKRKRQQYLPKLQGHDDDQYRAYLHRAVFYNMTSKTLNALYGTMFQRNPKISNSPPKLEERYQRFSKDGMSLNLTAKTAAKEVLAVGRYGMLVDAPPEGGSGAYVACYTAENIMDWAMEEIDGRWQFTRVVLREIYYERDNPTMPYEAKSRFRVLNLTPVEGGGHLYEQLVYHEREIYTTPDLETPPDDIVVPRVRGEPIGYIPFEIIGPFNNHPDVQKPPIMDIVTLNLSHYLSYAQLEQGRFYTANPVFWTSDSNEEPGNFYVGPDVVWELGKDGQAGIIEFNGQGLKSLENALDMKESQIAAIGGRLMPGGSGAAESDNSLKLKEQNENTLLLNIADTLDEAFTKVIRWWADWNNIPKTQFQKIAFEVNRDFLLKEVGAREFRAIHQMYADGIIPVTVVYEYLRKSEVVPDWLDEGEFKELLNDATEFPHMVDVLARMKNYPDAKTFHEHVRAREVQPSEGDPEQPGVPLQARQQRRNRETR